MRRAAWLKRVWSRSCRRTLAAICAFSAGLASASAQRPNILFILTDDQGIEAIEGPSWPNELACRTPNLMRLAERGRVFSQMRVNSKCSPTRASVLTGRSPFRTGVIDRLVNAPDSHKLSLQTEEITAAELMRAEGYYTILVGKWHLGSIGGEGESPGQQGFDRYVSSNDFMPLDDPEVTGDELITMLVDEAVREVQERPDPTQPYALFFWSPEPHRRWPDASGMYWWKVHDSLLPSGEQYYGPNDSELNRFRAVVEAMDTELDRLLVELDVIDEAHNYRNTSHTVVFCLGDNGADPRVTCRPDRAKGTVFEYGVRTPFFVFGENVPDDGQIIDTLMDAVDLFPTLLDVAGVDRSAPSPDPMDGMSFSDLIGWSNAVLPRRAYSLSSVGVADEELVVALTDGIFKIIVRAGYSGLALRNDDSLYDLLEDPAENHDLIRSMNEAQQVAYRRLRSEIVNHWPSAVNAPHVNQVDIPLTASACLVRRGGWLPDRLAVGHLAPGGPITNEARIFLEFDVEGLENHLPPGRDLSEVVAAQIVLAFRADAGGSDDANLGPVTVHPMLRDWTDRQSRWGDLEGAFDESELGAIDLPPHVVTDPMGTRLTGHPLPPGTPLSLGESSALLDWVQNWHSGAAPNYGVVLIAEPRPHPRETHQFATIMPIASLRLRFVEL